MSHRTARFVAALVPESGLPTDAELLARFATERDAAAFELLVWRHGGMVHRICRTVLCDRHAAEDATQAVFLALARQAGSVGRAGSAAGWLFRVARRVAGRAARRQVAPLEPVFDLNTFPAPTPTDPDRDAERAVQEEVARLPESHRAPVLLCFFEGLTHTEAAQRLGVPVGTVAGRIARAKETMAARLARRGFSLGVLAPAGVLIAPVFVSATARIAVTFATRDRTGVPSLVLELVNRELRVMALKRVLSGVATLVLVAAGACMSFGMGGRAEPPTAPAPRVAAEKPLAPKPPAPVIGKAFAIAPITTDLQRRLIRGAGADSAALLIVDTQALFRDAKTLNTEALQLAELRKGLKTFRREKGRSVVHRSAHYSIRHEISTESTEVLEFVLTAAVHAEDLVASTPHGNDTHHNFGFDFAKYTSPLKDETGADAAETGVGDERALAYPVRTPLSKALTGPTDGMVIVNTPIVCRGDAWLPEDVDRSVRAALGKLKLPKGSRINFWLNVRGHDDGWMDRVRRVCKLWAEDAGLELWQFIG